MNICCDIDDTLLDFVGTLLEFYNSDYSDNLTVDDITDWTLDLFVKPECGTKIYNYFSDPNLNLYWAVEPIKNSLESINLLKSKGHRVIFCTRSDFLSYKLKWLLQWKFLENDRDYVLCEDKTLVNCDIIVDDRYKYIEDFTKLGIPALLIDRPWNKKYPYKHKVYNWNDILENIEYIEDGDDWE